MSDFGLKFLYETVPGRAILGVLARPGLSAACGRFLDSRMSRRLVPGFVKRNGIDMGDYEPGPFPSFNAFFSRHLKSSDCRPFNMDASALTAPSDGLLTCVTVKGDTVLPVKQSHYTLSALLDDPTLAKEFHGGLCLVYRLCVDNYHRYAFFDGGTCVAKRRIPGRLHTVRPIALRNVPVFTENAREYVVLDTENFGRAIQMEVGALLVGKIANHPLRCAEGHEDDRATRFCRGQEKGLFLYGGSTIIVLLQPGRAEIDPAILAASAAGKETPVRMGQVVGSIKECVKGDGSL
jgi:phosphatidylserine decarboxylase